MKIKKYLLIIVVLFCVSCTLNQNTTNRISYSSLVDTRIGTVGKMGDNGLASGFTYLGATYPFGMIQLTPSHFAPQNGIVVNQISGGGCPEMGNFPLIAFDGQLEVSPNDMK